jgi:hypothetical protein
MHYFVRREAIVVEIRNPKILRKAYDREQWFLIGSENVYSWGWVSGERCQ